VEACLGDPGLEIVADRLAGGATQEGKGAHMRAGSVAALKVPATQAMTGWG
jgi:hypothetical protein